MVEGEDSVRGRIVVEGGFSWSYTMYIEWKNKIGGLSRGRMVVEVDWNDL